MQPYGREPDAPGNQPGSHPVASYPPYPGAGPQPAGPGWAPYPQPVRAGDRLLPTRRELAAAGAVVLGMAAAGLLAGLLWAWLAPRLEYRVVRPNLALPVVPEVEEFVAADGRFVVITLVAGALAGALCWWSRRTRGPALLVALAVGGLAGSAVAWRFGMLLGPGYEEADLQVVGRVIRQPLELGAQAALVVEPIAAVVVYLLATGFAAHNDLGRSDDQPAVPPPYGQAPYARQDAYARPDAYGRPEDVRRPDEPRPDGFSSGSG